MTTLSDIHKTNSILEEMSVGFLNEKQAINRLCGLKRLSGKKIDYHTAKRMIKNYHERISYGH